MSGGQVLSAVGDGEGPSSLPAGAGRVVGAHLRRLRKEQGLRLVDVVKAGLVGSAPTLSRIENGATPLKAEKVLSLARFYGVTTDSELDALVKLATRSHDAQWWEEFRDAIPGWLERLISVESFAEEIRTYEVQYVPGLLQTSAYSRAIMQRAFPDASLADPDKRQRRIERSVKVRQGRRALLNEASAPHFYALVDEAVLARPVGGASVMRQQLRELYSLEENVERIHIRVLPFSVGDEAMAPAPSITHLSFPADREEDMVYLEVRNGGSYVTNPEDVDRYRLALTVLWSKAATRDETLELLQHYIQQLSD
ncbi:helix-turn-helix transcriptional regulator [Streptomyces sp. NBC_01635]|uniref:helix-turn-helix domain-containing protein n=1 Tax=Streptomyces sp. NBC_01635 TaxID=2975904 RepID=UPI003869D2B0|nr:helix-turn-helix transcriptional regulator [Streptomyces sp. NBC_01635]WTD79560.1 helix-turn-helix transcriptional regulator [Streptomyces sp. NBC_01635]